MIKEKIKSIKVIYNLYNSCRKQVDCFNTFIKYVGSLKYISRNKKRLHKKNINKEIINVVFLIQYIPGWNKLEPIYIKMLKDDRFNPVIVCIPLNIQNNELQDDNGNDTYEYFAKQGKLVVNSLLDDGSWYDIRQLNPDIVFHSRPYNIYLPKCYTSGQVVKYALICNVLYGLSFTKDMRDVTLNKDYYNNVFCYYSADKSEAVFYKKKFSLGSKIKLQDSYPFGAIGLEQLLSERTEDTSMAYKKRVLWTPRWTTDSKSGGSNFFNYKDFLLEYAKANPDVQLVIRPHPMMFDNFIKTKEMSPEEVNIFKDYCLNESNIVLDESKEYTKTLWMSDILISDVSSIIPEYFITRKPIIYCHSNIDFSYTDSSAAIVNSCYQAYEERDIQLALDLLIEGNDPKMTDRDACIKTHYSDVKNNSTNICEHLCKI